MTTLVLAEDHNLVREGLKALLERESSLKVVGEAIDGYQAVELVKQLRPSLLLLDLMLPRLQGLDVLRQVRDMHATSTIVVSMYADQGRVVEAFRCGAAGYVLKEASSGELLRAIRSVLAGERYLSASMSQMALFASLKQGSNGGAGTYESLTPREKTIFQLAAEGHSTGRIAEQLFISRRTVETHRANLMKKLSLKSQTELVRFAIRKNLIAV